MAKNRAAEHKRADPAPETPPAPIPTLWDPQAARWWGLILTPAVGSLVLSMNWNRLGSRDDAVRAQMWAWVSGAAVAAAFLADPLLPDFPWMKWTKVAVAAALWLPWAVTEVPKQARAVAALPCYEPEPWGPVALAGALAGACLAIASVTLAMALRWFGYYG